MVYDTIRQMRSSGILNFKNKQTNKQTKTSFCETEIVTVFLNLEHRKSTVSNIKFS